MKMKWFWLISLCNIAFGSYCQLPEGFVDISEVNANIRVDLRYYSTDNFIGDTINGYNADQLFLTKAAALALSKVQTTFEKQQLGLKIFDAYRPQRAVDHFVRWCQIAEDTLMKAQYYPNIAKNQLINKGYIASKSGHSRGSTVDLTVIDLTTGKELDMGGQWDFFGKISHHADSSITTEQRMNRNLLKEHMLDAGFRAYKYEWWHYTLNGEPFKDQYFDF